jgi:small nuclear ribonucleoprotein (snRNP)-like protein
VIVELKNGLLLKGELYSVDQYLNVKLVKMSVVDAQRFPQLMSLSTVFVRGSVIRYIQLPKADVDTQLLQDAARRAARTN